MLYVYFSMAFVLILHFLKLTLYNIKTIYSIFKKYGSQIFIRI